MTYLYTFLFACFCLALVNGTTLDGSIPSVAAPLMNMWAAKYSAAFPGKTLNLQIQNEELLNVNHHDEFTIVAHQPTLGNEYQPIPVAITPLVCVYNLPGLSASLTFPQKVLAAIWAGNITNWSDDVIKSANPSAKLPNATIIRYAMSGSSQLTLAFTTALATLSSDWKARYGGGFSNSNGFYVSGTTALQNSTLILFNDDERGLASQVTQNKYSIAFVSLSDAMQVGAPFAMIHNRYSLPTFPLPTPVAESVQSVTFDNRTTASLYNLDGMSTYPILTLVYAVVQRDMVASDCGIVTMLYDFIRWALLETSAAVVQLGYFPVPSGVVNTGLNKLTGLSCNGQPIRQYVIGIGGGSNQAGALVDDLSAAFSRSFISSQMNFQKIGTAKAVAQITASPPTLDYGIVEMDLSDAEFASVNGDIQVVPTFVNAAAVVHNVPGTTAGVTLQLSRDALVGIFNGSITNWNDPAITQLNPFIFFTSEPIKLVFYAPGTSALTMVFKRALNSFNPKWSTKNDISINPTWSWDIGNSRRINQTTWTGVGTSVKSTAHTLAFVPRATAVSMGLQIVSIPNKKGTLVKPTLDAVAAAASTAVFDARFQSNIVDSDADAGYPIVSFTSFILRKTVTGTQQKCDVVKEVLDFVIWVGENDSAAATIRSNGFIPAFSGKNDQVRAALARIACNGVIVMPLPVNVTTSETINPIPIVIPIVVGVAGIGAIAFVILRKVKKRLAILRQRLNDVQIAVELSESIAMFDLDKMKFLEDFQEPTPTQRSCLRIFRTLKMVEKYIPQALLYQLRHPEEANDEEEEEHHDEVELVGNEATEEKTKRKQSMLSSATSATSATKLSDAKSVASKATAAKKGGKVAGAAYRRGSHISTSSKGSSLVETKLVRRGITIVFLRITNFLTLLKSDSADTVKGYNGFIGKLFPIVTEARGTIASMDGETVVMHWNAARKSASARIEACETAVKILAMSLGTQFNISIGIAYANAWYSSIGCDAMSTFAVLGPLIKKAALLQRMNEHYGTSILADEEVRQSGCRDALFAMDVVTCESCALVRNKIYELVPAAMVSRNDYDGEWLYAFPSDVGVQNTRHTYWQDCTNHFFAGNYDQARTCLQTFVKDNSEDPTTAPLVTFANAMLALINARSGAGVASSGAHLSVEPMHPKRSGSNLGVDDVVDSDLADLAKDGSEAAAAASSPASGAADASSAALFVHTVEPKLTFHIEMNRTDVRQ